MKNMLHKGFAHILILLPVVLILVGVATYYGLLYYDKIIPEDLEPPKVTSALDMVNRIHTSPTPTPFPFQEMTIASLCARTFESELTDLKEFTSASTYTTYLTSYDSDGLRVNGLLSIPKGEMPAGGWPAVVFVHGYIPPAEYETTSNYLSYMNFLASRGLVVFKIDLRGHDESEGEAYGAYYSEAYVVDTLNARGALANTDFVNPERIGLWGHSMAGNVTFRSFVAAQDIAKLVIWAGAVYTYEDLADYRIQDSSYQPPASDSERTRRRQELFETYGDFDPADDFWKQVVPTNYLDGVVGDIQIHHAVNDNVVNIGYSRNLIKVLEGTGIGSELFEYSSGGHNITGSAFTQAMQRSADFFKE